MGSSKQRPHLFAWLDLIGFAMARKQLTSQQGGLALLVAGTASGTGGQGAVVDAKQLAASIGCSERQVWRHWHTLVETGWFTQTQKPQRPRAGERGQRAVYRLTFPRVELAHGSQADHSAKDQPSDAFSVPSDIAKREVGTVLPSNPYPSEGVSVSQVQRAADRCPNGPVAADGSCCDRCHRETAQVAS